MHAEARVMERDVPVFSEHGWKPSHIDDDGVRWMTFDGDVTVAENELEMTGRPYVCRFYSDDYTWEAVGLDGAKTEATLVEDMYHVVVDNDGGIHRDDMKRLNAHIKRRKKVEVLLRMSAA